MTEPDQQADQQGERGATAESGTIPVTGQPAVDHALTALQGLESEPLTDHHDRLAAVHEELHAALNPDQPDAG
ncbi:hypothetical protein GCM10011575_04770 [Microlunatus endophyticus]|uniref:Uncharacterized protein n=1 Tax=Microlunatus endophyticus TaxID=1716077 RepID=A0A917S0B4_9ACTN|nr:hypothetical protein [Microlunatus endophyticus]GGL49654.1 hypothetical protein GCM10011575_04770 [Microlunatus endophyticus]